MKTTPFKISCSIVAYQNPEEIILKAINSFLAADLPSQLWLVDNSPTDKLRKLTLDKPVNYIHKPENVGFGMAHNCVIDQILDSSDYHLVLNPDVYFDKGTLETMIAFMESNQDVGLSMPKVFYPDGRPQHLCKMLPDPFVFFARQVFGNTQWVSRMNDRYELKFTGYDKPMDVPYLSGCFMLFRTSELKRLGGFEERIFLYVEDTDISRRFYTESRAVYYPEASIYHYFARGSHRNLKLLYHCTRGAMVYFNKYGWFFDRERKRINESLLDDLGYEKKKTAQQEISFVASA